MSASKKQPSGALKVVQSTDQVSPRAPFALPALPSVTPIVAAGPSPAFGRSDTIRTQAPPHALLEAQQQALEKWAPWMQPNMQSLRHSQMRQHTPTSQAYLMGLRQTAHPRTASTTSHTQLPASLRRSAASGSTHTQLQAPGRRGQAPVAPAHPAPVVAGPAVAGARPERPVFAYTAASSSRPALLTQMHAPASIVESMLSEFMEQWQQAHQARIVHASQSEYQIIAAELCHTLVQCIAAQQGAPLHLRLDKHRLLLGQRVLWEAPQQERHVVYQWYRDEIRELRIMPGITPEECFTLLQILDQTANDSNAHEDTVTLLWASSLPHVHYMLRNDFQRTHDFDFSSQRQQHIHATQSLKHQALTVSEAGLGAAKALEKTRLHPTEAEQSALQVLIQDEEVNVLPRFLNVLALLLTHESTIDIKASIQSLFQELQQPPEEVEALHKLTVALDRLQMWMRVLGSKEEPSAKGLHRLLQQLSARTNTKPHIEALVRLLDRQKGKASAQFAIASYFQRMPLQHVSPWLEALSLFENHETQAFWYHLLAQKCRGRLAALSTGLQHPDPVVLQHTCQLLCYIRAEGTFVLLRSIFSHLKTPRRVQLLKGIVALSPQNEEVAACALLLQAMNDDNVQVRHSAHELLRQWKELSPTLLNLFFDRALDRVWSTEARAEFLELLLWLSHTQPVLLARLYRNIATQHATRRKTPKLQEWIKQTIRSLREKGHPHFNRVCVQLQALSFHEEG